MSTASRTANRMISGSLLRTEVRVAICGLKMERFTIGRPRGGDRERIGARDRIGPGDIQLGKLTREEYPNFGFCLPVRSSSNRR